MALTQAQMQALKAYIEADATLNAQPNTNAGNSVIANVLNAVASPDFIVWRTNLTGLEVYTAAVKTEIISRSQGERDVFQMMLNREPINPALSDTRQAFQDIFSGPSGATTRANLIAIAKRPALLIEKILASGTGSDANPATMGREGTISTDEIETARAS